MESQVCRIEIAGDPLYDTPFLFKRFAQARNVARQRDRFFR
jgi:hypothetical protein